MDLRREVGQGKIRLRVCLQIIEAEVGEIGDENVFRKLLFGYAGEIVQGLLVGPIEILATGFVLDDQHAFPEQIDGTGLVAQFFDRGLEGGHAAAGDAEDIEEFVPEGLRFRFFPDRRSPAEGKFHGAITDLFLA